MKPHNKSNYPYLFALPQNLHTIHAVPTNPINTTPRTQSHRTLLPCACTSTLPLSAFSRDCALSKLLTLSWTLSFVFPSSPLNSFARVETSAILILSLGRDWVIADCVR